ncbi:methionyl-tRNA formyltransferase [Fulvivirgaceae bacterium PWU4]|uniref:Methionyl-tRNA formyltransferase n=1 Tax=Chryseosolibacter histidini TaxID=2782349 RepID=A0AAP2DMT1_9BACT|nr:methionyl-tRNA formyltransferase [Chryseosolibacter histidini]MBT1699161.1 methionyl-tRNA formyltransferase [Chryseosolibacter histidini]
MMADLRIIFMGTPEFAVPSLEMLVANKLNVVAVITAPDKPQGRGQKIVHSPVKACALQHNIPVLQPTNLKSPEFLEELKSYNAQLQVVVAFRMLPQSVWDMPEIGTFNLHASLLPDYRGAAPINWAIINGEKETGVTTFFLEQEIDTGSIIFQEKEPIDANDTAGSLYERLMNRGAALVLKTVTGIAAGKYQSTPQPKGAASKPAPKIFKETCEINWNQTSEQVRNFVRGLSPYPAAWATIEGKTYKIFKVSIVSDNEKKSAGEYTTDHKRYLYFKTEDGWVSVDELQPEGKRKMGIEDFFRGNRL